MFSNACVGNARLPVKVYKKYHHIIDVAMLIVGLACLIGVIYLIGWLYG